MDELAGSATRVPGLRGRAMVDVDQLAEIAQRLSSAIPSDVQEAQLIIKQRESMIDQAQLEAHRIREAAEDEGKAIKNTAHEEHLSRISETEVVKAAELKAEQINQDALQEAQQILQEAQRRAHHTLDDAHAAAATRREGADQYARETLFDLEERLSGLLGQVRRGIDNLGLEVEASIPA